MATEVCQSLGLITWGIARTADAPVYFGVARHSDAIITFGVAAHSISEPRNPLAVHLGAGVVQMYVLPPLSGSLLKYEVQTSKALAGPYKPVGLMNTSQKDLFLFNFPIGSTVYLRIRAISLDRTASEWVQVRRGEAQLAKVIMWCRSVHESQIPANALFTMPKNPGRLVGFRSDQLVIFQ
jgi:hypothetical protein